MNSPQTHIKKPSWLKVKLPNVYEYAQIKKQLTQHKLHTICESGQCPNIGECWKNGTATLMILGNICTRNCSFCAVSNAKPLPVDINEPDNIALIIKDLQIKHCVLTSVTRDDLDDGGAHLWAKTIQAIKNIKKEITLECLIPDFNGCTSLIDIIINEKPHIISHNLETVERLSPIIRNKANYKKSLGVISYISSKGIKSKSGLMLGLGETEKDILQTMDDLITNRCKILTLGQYLQPSKSHYPVQSYISPEQFTTYKKIALSKGFEYVESAPLVRSSYNASLHI